MPIDKSSNLVKCDYANDQKCNYTNSDSSVETTACSCTLNENGDSYCPASQGNSK
jgi:hypothetical protein